MSEERKKKEYLARLETNMVFILADVLESLMTECDNINHECGYYLRFDMKRHFNKAMHSLKLFRGETRYLDEKQQLEFGDDSDLMLDLFYAAVTRTGTDNIVLLRFMEYIMSFEDKLGLDSVRTGGDAFEAIKKKLSAVK